VQKKNVKKRGGYRRVIGCGNRSLIPFCHERRSAGHDKPTSAIGIIRVSPRLLKNHKKRTDGQDTDY